MTDATNLFFMDFLRCAWRASTKRPPHHLLAFAFLGRTYRQKMRRFAAFGDVTMKMA
jgi:hypothetical protein